MMMIVLTGKDVYRELMGTTCSVCGATKPTRRSFCKVCYFALPGKLRKALYKRWFDGYAYAHCEAKTWLAENRKSAPQFSLRGDEA